MIDAKKYSKILRYLLIILLLSNFIRTNYNLKIPTVTFFIFCMLLIANDIIRNIIDKENVYYYFSLVLSITIAASLKYFVHNFITDIYMFLYVIEILYIQGRCKKILLSFHGILYITVVILNTRSLNIASRLTTIGINFLIYLGVIYILYLSHILRDEREETKKLNEELKLSNIKLQEYSLKLEELSIAKERQRVAQELHDSLGHSLMALTMHLDFAEKIFDTDINKAKEVISKVKSISKDSTSSLRIAVNTLKEERNIENLRSAINELIDSFLMLGNIKIVFNMNKHIEKLNPDIKLCIYKTIRESLTNGIKHGKATVFNLDIDINLDNVELIIKDNGEGCDHIIKSNGLNGIENRILALGGTVHFDSYQNHGFLIKAQLPIYEVY